MDPTAAPSRLRPAIEARCSGAPRELGWAQGEALRGKIIGIRRSLAELDAFRLEQPRWLPYPVYLRLAERRAAAALLPALQRAAPDALARLEGLAEGAGVTIASLALLNALEALLSSLEGRTAPAPPGGCSALAVRGARSRLGEPLVAKNFDYLPQVQPFYTLRESRPRSGYRSLEFTVAPLVGAIDGVNERGLCITLNYAFVTDPARPGPPITMTVAEALGRCTTAAEAAAWIAQRPRWGGGLLLLADAAGDLAALELSNTRAALRRPAPGDDWLAITNICTCASTGAVQVADAAVFAGRVPRALLGQRVLQPHRDRAGRIAGLVRARGVLGPDDVAVVMADHGPAGAPDGASPCVHTPYWGTTACLQWFPASRRVRVSYSAACAAEYVDLAL